ncbi:GAP family protein [Micromonospora sp. HM5-17]|uniref:GAP family protein n=1 Tax=Micromonospora sp. HM5-17 TaxID=2487710 RepID=UPI000F4AA20B|nr:GAP family protein [Micromonospora sp. HM5-17]ROT32330.1 hypothetical protein EF879_12235 [Micromonospora sp. HM5-17]
MNAALLLSLAGLALLDSTSIGTLFIPVWLLLSPKRISVGRVLGYLGTIALFYFGVGLLLVYGGGRLMTALDRAGSSVILDYVQLAVGVGLLVLSFRFDGRRRRGPGPAARWRDRVTGGTASAGWLVGLALLAALAEVATMLPYLGAIGLMATADLADWTVPVLLAGYCLVMVLPAGVLLATRAAVPGPTERLLGRLNTWIVEKGGSTTGWIIGIAGFLIARDAAIRLGFLDF